MTEYLAKDYRISALPFHHEDSSSFTLFLTERPNGEYLVFDRFHAHLTRDGQVLPTWFTYDRVSIDAFERLCSMKEEEAFRVAKEHLPKMTVNGFTAENVKELEKLSLEDVAEYRKRLIASRGDNYAQKRRDMHIETEEEFLAAASYS